METLKEQIKVEFNRRFDRDPVMVCSGGRVNLIGEHVDYNEGFVMPAAIDLGLIFAIASNGTNNCRIYSVDFKEEVSFSLNELSPGDQWVNYIMGVLAGFKQRGFSVGGVDCVFGGNIPGGAGLSSSAALCCGFGFAINLIFESKAKRIELARIAQFSEHQFAGVKCGLMDQYAILFGVPGSAMLLDCRSMTHQDLPFPTSPYTIVLVDSKVKHTLATSSYNERRAACEEGIRILRKFYPDVQSLRDINEEQLIEHRGALGNLFPKCLFVVEEIARTREAAEKLLNNDLPVFGQLMYQSHEGLRRLYEVSCAELDFLVDLARKHVHLVIGSRMVGGGFGGCTINLVYSAEMENFMKLVSSEYLSLFGITPDFYPVTISQGVHRTTD